MSSSDVLAVAEHVSILIDRQIHTKSVLEDIVGVLKNITKNIDTLEGKILILEEKLMQADLDIAMLKSRTEAPPSYKSE